MTGKCIQLCEITRGYVEYGWVGFPKVNVILPGSANITADLTSIQLKMASGLPKLQQLPEIMVWKGMYTYLFNAIFVTSLNVEYCHHGHFEVGKFAKLPGFHGENGTRPEPRIAGDWIVGRFSDMTLTYHCFWGAQTKIIKSIQKSRFGEVLKGG